MRKCDISKCNPSGGRIDPTKLDGFDEFVYCGINGEPCYESPYIEWGLQFKNMTEEETLAAEDYGKWLKKWAKTKGYAK